MNVTKEVILDLFPLYAANECSADTRALVDAYLRAHPADAAEFTRAAAAADSPFDTATEGRPRELDLLRDARRRARTRSLLMGLAIFCSAAPFSFYGGDGHRWMMLTDAPFAAATYGLVGVALWIAYAVHCRRYADR